ncbi:HAD hydrolase-like protein [Paenibacillus sp. N4]|nr:HAD hydrolase-like protein [Paenibacillus vietnamensis]
MADSKQLAIDIYNELAETGGYKPIERQKVSLLSSLSIPDRMKELNIPAVHLPKLIFDFKKIYKRKVHTLFAVEGISELLMTLSDKGLKPDIISSNRADTIEAFIESNHFSGSIGSVFSGRHLFGKHRLIDRYIKLHRFSKEELIYVGDELRDIEACKRAGIKMIAVTWGFDSKELLQNAKPDFVANKPHEIVEILGFR